MKINSLLIALGLSALFLSCSDGSPAAHEKKALALIPEPVQLERGQGSFTFNENTRFVVKDNSHGPVANLLANKFMGAAGFVLSTVSETPESNYVLLTTDQGMAREAYSLAVTPNHIKITAGSYPSLVHGIQTLRQLLPAEIEMRNAPETTQWTVPSLTIEDHPRYPWRGLMLDVSRHFFDKEYIKESIDRMALFKLNVLHLHLVDDQGWRLEIKKYPKLTEVGAFRVDQEEKHWNARNTNQPGDSATYGGFYTQDDIREIVAYAQMHGISVMPEIEMPAHVTSAVAAYPEYSCKGTPVAVPSGGIWPITDIYCAGKESTFAFLEDVMMETMTLFPFEYIHVGGDEATKTNWETCPDCQRRMREEGLANTEELQSYFIKRMERFLSSKGRTLVGWDEILEGGLPAGATVMSWRGIQGGWEASKEGHDVIMTPGTVYLNHYQGEPDYEPIAFGGYEPLNKVYAFDPVVDSMSVAQKEHVLGSQANLWSEYVTNNEESEYMLFPRVTALSEGLWTPKEKKDWAAYAAKIPALFERLEAMNVTYARSAYAVTAKSKLTETGGIAVSLANEFPESSIRYALNEAPLTKESPIYTAPLKLEGTTTVKAAVFENGEIVGDTLVKHFNFHKAVGATVQYDPIYSKRYQGTGADNLVNVFRGSKNFHDGQWQAWLEDDALLTLDLGRPKTFSSVAVGAMENQGSGIYYPTGIKVMVSEDGKTFREVGRLERPHQDNGFVNLETFKVIFDELTAQYIKVEVTNLAHPPTGGSCFIFLDEVLVE
ncbi:family 20 glycosylhydrolase [Maribacter sp. 2307ULW6-5]|uniref:glycoside hydrolase family 20 protein n=1 Tax=Maribacter sp. 2307ULW6-5 TaxID=3386275 RepID=UPI0039BCBD1B